MLDLAFFSVCLGELDKLRMSGMCLPSSSTVQRYKSFRFSDSGWSEKLVDGLKRSMGKLPPKARYGILFFDEKKVKKGLVYNAHTGDLIGVCEEGAEVGTHVLQFFWSCTYTNFSYPLAFFVTKTANYLDISKHFWDGVRYLMAANLTVLAAIFGGSPSNRRFLELITLPNAFHLARNIISEKVEDIILSDPPHLAKKFRSAATKSTAQGI